jgi:hypothetical protein
MSDTCLAKFVDPVEARAAIRRLLQSGVAPESMEVMTSQPIHGERFIPEKKPTRLPTWALIGAGVGLLAGFSLATITSLNYPLVKGGMPIVAPWTVGIITYEATMLGAVLATLAGLLVELRLPNFKNLPYDPSVADGGILLAVRCPSEDSRASVENALRASGAPTVNWV